MLLAGAGSLLQQEEALDRFIQQPVIQSLAGGLRGFAVEVSRPDLAADEYRTRIYFVHEKGWEPATSGDRTENTPRWSPDGTRLAYLRESRRGKDRYELVIWSRSQADRPPFAWRGDIQDFAWSPDGRRIAFVGRPAEERRAAAERAEAPLVVDRLNWFTDEEGPDLGLRQHLYVADLERRGVRQLTRGDWDDSEPAWSPDGGTLAFVSSRGEQRFASYDEDLYLIPASGGEARRLTRGRTVEEAPAWSPDGSWIAFAGTTRVDDDGAAAYLWIVRPDGTGLRNLTASLDRSLAQADGCGLPVWLDGGRLLFALEDGGGTRLGTAGVDGNLVLWPRQPGVFEFLHRTPAGDLAALWSSPDQPRRPVRLLPAETGLAVSGAAPPLDPGPGSPPPAARGFEVRTEDGLRVEAWLLPPAGRTTAGPHPTILHVHGGPQGRFDESFDPEHQLWAAAGYAVLYANPRGSTGYGQDFTDRVRGRYGLEDFQDLVAVTDEAVERGWADPERLYITGYSYGGMMTNWAVTRTTRFRAAASGAGLSDYAACYGVDDSLITWDQEFGPPWKEPDLYRRLSPATYADRVETPLLLLHGAEDGRCPVSQSMHYFALLKSRGLDTRLVIYPGENHDFADHPSHVLDYERRILAWFRDH